ncbi:hypothetical protein [Paratractidigestivibacter sp.]|uniref:hypothetical protein n=1 Tax=Paratractidigestivibacter sp. TaxID=2847316 RepID=UPI002ACB1713|nr:hypothetical protein [Paratractidigestivibacter sp.]
MTTETKSGMTVLIAGAGKILTSDGIYSEVVYLGVYDDPSNWREVEADAEREPPQDEELEAENALSIITGGVI